MSSKLFKIFKKSINYRIIVSKHTKNLFYFKILMFLFLYCFCLLTQPSVSAISMVSAEGVYYDWFDFLLARIIVSRLRQPIKLLRIDNFRHKEIQIPKTFGTFSKSNSLFSTSVELIKVNICTGKKNLLFLILSNIFMTLSQFSTKIVCIFLARDDSRSIFLCQNMTLLFFLNLM